MYILTSKNIEIFKMKLSWNKLSQLLQCIAIPCFISQVKTFLLKNKQNNYDINRNIRFFINLHLYLHLFKVQFTKATSKTWTLKNLDPEKQGSWKRWNIYRIKKCITLKSYVLTKSKFLLIKYSVPTILIERTNLFRVKSLNMKFSK